MKIQLYEIFDRLSRYFRYKSTYLELKTHFLKVLNKEESSYVKSVHDNDRQTGKTIALARISAKYKVPIIVSTESEKRRIEKYIYENFHKYFRKNKPWVVLCTHDNLRYLRKNIFLVDETLKYNHYFMIYDFKPDGIVGYQTLSKIGEQILETPNLVIQLNLLFLKTRRVK